MSDYYEVIRDLGNGLLIVEGDLQLLREQDVNAHVMAPDTFEKLVENIRKRGALESLPFAAQPNPAEPPEVVSGHHRIRAGIKAGIRRHAYLLDTNALTRSQIVAKQIAHNKLVGIDDSDVLRKLAQMLENVEDMLESGLEQDFLPTADEHEVTLWTPHADFAFKTVTFTFLPHQFENLSALIEALRGPQDLVVVALAEQWDAFLRATAKYSRLKDVRAAGTVVALITETALREVQAEEARQAPDDVPSPAEGGKQKSPSSERRNGSKRTTR